MAGIDTDIVLELSEFDISLVFQYSEIRKKSGNVIKKGLLDDRTFPLILAVFDNDYYPSSNLPSLLRARGRSSDIERARFIGALVVEQIERSLSENGRDEWARPTLLGAAFDAGDVDKAEELADRIEDEGPVRWKLESTLSDLRDRVHLAEDAGTREALAAVVERLQELV